MRLNTEGIFIKISGVTTEDDALFSIGLGASAIGFDFGPTPRQISVNAAHDIVRRLPAGAISVGVFRNEMPKRIVEIANTLGLTAVQIDGPVASEELAYVAERVNTVLRSLPSTANHDLVATLTGIDYLVIPESDDQYSLMDCLELFSDQAVRTPIVASGGLTPSNVIDIVQNYPVWGVDVRSGVEKSVGEKDPVLLGQFIANARWAFANTYVERHHDEWPM
ncbi:MAG TPA: phosphoribosylanthranilate isomerase [Acidimicrobiales bacterium]|nr:phosphoribosylanthranilate isomerase [Acidimicrobiales bacterium]